MNLDLDQLLDENKPIYVINTSNPKGTLMCTFTDASGKNAKVLKIPKTWIPINVTAQAPKAILRDSLDFREHLYKRMITLISPEDALKILATEDAQEEVRILSNSDFAHNSSFASQRAKDLIAASDNSEQMKIKGQLKLENEEQNAANEINPAVIDIAHRYNQKDLDAKMALREFRCIQETLKADDLDYVIGNCDSSIREWARELVKDLVKK